MLDVDHALVTALEGVEYAVREYLAGLSESRLSELRDSLTHLDDLADASDQWARSLASFGAWGYVNRNSAIGQTSATPVIDHEVSSLFQVQVNLVHAAKAVVQGPSPNSVEALRAAWSDVEHCERQAK
jgi:hypothetical protein